MGDILIPSPMMGAYSGLICLRASRFWDFFYPHDETKLLHTDLVLLDEEGNSIHAQMYPPLHEQFKPLIKEGSVYNFKYFNVRKCNRMYKPVRNPYMIGFSKWTTVEEVIEMPPAFPLCTYSLTPIEQVPAQVDNNEYLMDVIGVVTEISNVMPHWVRARQSDSLKRVVTIRNARNASANVVLWGERATAFPGEKVCNDGQTSPQIVIFVGALVRNYADGIAVSGNSSCKWYINPEVPEANILMASAINMHEPIKLNQIITSSGPIVPAEHKKICEIKDLNPFQFKKTEFLVTVTIRKIKNSWWYHACGTCQKTAKPYGDSFKCTDFGCGIIGLPTQRYKLCIYAGDETGDTDFIIFGRMAQRLIKKSADTLITENPRGFIPDEITRLLEKVFLWNVSITENTIVSENVCFQVNAIVGEIDDGNALIPATPTGSQTSSLMLSQGASSNMQATPQKNPSLPLPSLPANLDTSYDSCATPSKRVVHTHELPVTPQSGRGTNQTETTLHKGVSLALLPLEEDSGHAQANLEVPPTLKRSPENPQDNDDTILPKPAVDLGNSATKVQKNVTKKITRPSTNKRVAKKLLLDEDSGDEYDGGCADHATRPSPSKDA